MRIYTKAGDLAFRTFNFPDGQPHFILETYERDFQSVTIEVAIKNPTDLFTTLAAASVLRDNGYSEIRLDVRYLMGARMDRAIDTLQPFTLGLVARLLNGAGFSGVRILDVHSDVATRLIRNSKNVLPFTAVKQVLTSLGYPVVVSPDNGAYDRVFKITHEIGSWRPFVQCSKKRDPQTGSLTGFMVLDKSPLLGIQTNTYNDCLIIDDICDGGGTFVGLAKELRKAGAKKVSLYVTHGIFSKGLPLEGIDHVYTTDSYTKPVQEWAAAGRGQDVFNAVTVIPVSMKELA